MTQGRPSPPFRRSNELRNRVRGEEHLERVARRLLPAPLDVVGRGHRGSVSRRAAVCAARRIDRGNAAGT
jgi:hypothetical protein